MGRRRPACCDDEEVHLPYLVKEVGGVRIGVIGFTDPDVPERQPPGYRKGLSHEGADVLPPLIDEIRRTEPAWPG